MFSKQATTNQIAKEKRPRPESEESRKETQNENSRLDRLIPQLHPHRPVVTPTPTHNHTDRLSHPHRPTTTHTGCHTHTDPQPQTPVVTPTQTHNHKHRLSHPRSIATTQPRNRVLNDRVIEVGCFLRATLRASPQALRERFYPPLEIGLEFETK